MPYLTLEEIPEGRLCRPLFIPDDGDWLALFGGALTELTKVWNYQQFGALTPEEMAEACELIITDWYEGACGTCELPDGDPIMQLGENGEFLVLENGEWVEPTGDYAVPSPSARGESTAEERRCLASANAENALKLIYEEVTDIYGQHLALVESVVEVGVFIAALINPAVGLTVKALALVALGVWRYAFDLAEFVTADLWNTDFTNSIRCILFRQSNDDAGVVTFDFDAVNAELVNEINFFDPTFASFALAGQVRWLLSQIGAGGLNLAGTGTAITSFDCDVCDTCTGTSVNFTTSDEDFATDEWDTHPAAGSYGSGPWGVGWYATTTGGANRIGIAGAIANACGRGIQMNVNFSGGMPFAPTVYVRVTTGLQIKTAQWTPGVGPNTALWNEGGSIIDAPALVEIAYVGASGYGFFIASFQTGNVA